MACIKRTAAECTARLCRKGGEPALGSDMGGGHHERTTCQTKRKRGNRLTKPNARSPTWRTHPNRKRHNKLSLAHALSSTSSAVSPPLAASMSPTIDDHARPDCANLTCTDALYP